MNTTNPKHTPLAFRIILVCLSTAILFLSSIAPCLAAGDLQRYAGHGILTAIEGQNSVVIENKGYLVDNAVLVENALGKLIPLRALLPPVQVEFEYCYMARAPKSMVPVIVSIKMTPKAAVHKKVSR